MERCGPCSVMHVDDRCGSIKTWIYENRLALSRDNLSFPDKKILDRLNKNNIFPKLIGKRFVVFSIVRTKPLRKGKSA